MHHSFHVPQLTHHKATGRAVVHLNGKDYYLGPFGSAEAKARYSRLAFGRVRRLPIRRERGRSNAPMLALRTAETVMFT
jgi:hypothetical protein